MTQMTEEWVSFWYQCLSENIDYSNYCSARMAADTAKSNSFEVRFPRMADIYEDFGSLDGWPEGGIKSQRWQVWFEPRRHLFLIEPVEITTPATYEPTSSRLLLSIPLQSDVEATVSTVKKFLTDYYSNHEIKKNSKPKYKLNTIDGRVAHGYQKVRQACLTSYRSYSFDADFEYRSIKAAILEFLKHEIDELGWEMKPDVRKELIEHGTMSPDAYESYRVMLDKARRDFKAFSRNAIRGCFPDDIPFASEVMDQFRGE